MQSSVSYALKLVHSQEVWANRSFRVKPRNVKDMIENMSGSSLFVSAMRPWVYNICSPKS